MTKLSEILREDAEFYEAQLETLPASYRPKGYAKAILERAAAERQIERADSTRSSITGY